MRSAPILSCTVFSICLAAQLGCSYPLEPSDLGAGGGDGGGQHDISVVVSVGDFSTCTCGDTSGGAGGDDAGSGGSEVGSTGAQSGSGAGGAPGTTSGTGGAPGTTSGTGGESATTGGTGGESATTGGTGGESATTGGTGGESATTGGTGGESATTGGTGGESATTGGTGGSPGTTGSGDASTASSGSGDTTGSAAGQGAGGAGGSGEGTGTGSGGAEPSACPGEAHALDLGDSVSIFATTEGGSNQLDTCFDFDDGVERVYDFTIAAAGSMHVTLVDSDKLDAMFVLTPGCGDLSEQRCFDSSEDGEEAWLPVDAGTFSLVVEAMHGTKGDFVLNVDLHAPECGDGVLNAGEDCDVGPGLPGDGCGDPGSPTACLVETPPPNVDTCPGEPISIAAGTTTLLATDGRSTLGFTDDYGGSCRLQDGGKDRVFTMTPAVSGTVTARVGFNAAGTEPACFADWTSVNCWDQLIYARSACASDATDDELACADDTGGEGEVITFPVTSGEPFYLFVDGYDGEWYSEGPFNLFVELVP